MIGKKKIENTFFLKNKHLVYCAYLANFRKKIIIQQSEYFPQVGTVFNYKVALNAHLCVKLHQSVEGSWCC